VNCCDGEITDFLVNSFTVHNSYIVQDYHHCHYIKVLSVCVSDRDETFRGQD